MYKIVCVSVWNINTDTLLMSKALGEEDVKDITASYGGGFDSFVVTFYNGKRYTFNFPSDKVYNEIVSIDEGE